MAYISYGSRFQVSLCPFALISMPMMESSGPAGACSAGIHFGYTRTRRPGFHRERLVGLHVSPRNFARVDVDGEIGPESGDTGQK